MPDETIDPTIQRGIHRGEMLARISTRLVQLHSQHYGKGPTKAKTHQVDDTVICILRDGFTTAERTLLASGRHEAVHRMRRGFQEAMETRFRNVIEEETGRRTIAYMSTLHTDPDLAVELFVLEPLPDGDGAGGEDGAGPDEGA